ncbi:MAG: porin family protein [Proteobacteria bacterium]|nr:porin family protein [Pseudomonadota bacterium]
MRNFSRAILTASIFATSLSADPVRGVFASLNIGGAFISQNHDYTGPSGATNKEKISKLSTAFGASFGLLNQIEKTKAVIGGEASFSLNQARQKYTLNANGGNTDGNLTITNPYSFGVYGIAGMMMTPKLMFYGKAGYAWIKTQLKYTGLNGENPNFQTYKKTMSGVSGGAGINYLLTNKFMVGAEYLYHSPSSITPRNNNTPQGGQVRKFVYHPSVHTLNLKLSMLF